LFTAGCTSSGSPANAANSASSGRPAHAPSASPSMSAPGPAGNLESQYVSIVDHVLPSVVEISTDKGLGSGVVFDDNGDIVTNDHVVGTAKTFKVRLATGAGTRSASLVGTYPPDDLAVIKLQSADGVHPASFGDSGKIQVGDIVLAMGNPLGLASSVTNGIVSATGRTVTEPQSGTSPGATLPDVIQTSASINPGNSGGALVDLSGDVIGIPTLAATDQQIGGAAPGIGFAIPSNVVTDIAGQLIKHGKVVNSHRAALGVGVVTLVGQNGNPAGAGVVNVTSGGPADQAGLHQGEVITAINGNSVPTTEALSQALAQLKPGDKATLTVTKQDGSTAKVTVTLGQLGGS
jgi:S1-C subfamily serine protease